MALPSGNTSFLLYLDMIGYLLDDPCSSEGIDCLSRSIGSVAITHNTQNDRESFIMDKTTAKIIFLIIMQVQNHAVLGQCLKELNFEIECE